MKALETASSSALLTEITQFIQNSENGVIRGMI
jgi:hypothetical protein